MKRFIAVVSVIVFLVILMYYGIFYSGWDFSRGEKEVTAFTKTDENSIYIQTDSGWEAVEIKGVNLGSGVPGKFSTDFAIDKETYMRWFGQMKDMGANTVRIYTIQSDDFYEAFYEFNNNNPDPLWLIQGVWVSDYVQNSRLDAYSEEYYEEFINHCKMAVDVIHGRRNISFGKIESAGSGKYRRDISPWVIGYILGVEWDDITVEYTNDVYRDDESKNSYKGMYMYTSDKASPFEAMLASVGDQIISYESEKYGHQRLVAFSNWVTTDPFDYPDNVKTLFQKTAKVDVENILTTDDFMAGQFASYHVYPYYPDYLRHVEDWSGFETGTKEEYTADDGSVNTYKAYLIMLNRHHTRYPVVISEFGVPSSRGITQIDKNTGRDQGFNSEKEQGEILARCYADIKDAGSAGSCVFTWQDEWFKRTWNTMYAVNLDRTAYWSDYQTNEQYFGLLSFDPGDEESVCYVDGDISEWSDGDAIGDNISVKYDEKFIYFMVEKKGFDLDTDKLYIPVDVTPNSGSTHCDNYNLDFDREADFVIAIDGKENSSIVVQERYEVLKSTYSEQVYKINAYDADNIPEKDSSKFVDIDNILMIENENLMFINSDTAETFNTGKMVYGNADPESKDFNSLADFCVKGDFIEIKLPWQIFNFSDPSRMRIHDDYYEHHDIREMAIKEIYAGVSGEKNEMIEMYEVPLKGWGKDVTYHERLKSSYYTMQKIWR